MARSCRRRRAGATRHRGAVHDRTDGIPLHVEELIGLLAERDREPVPATAQDVPDTLEAAILGRFGLRSPEARRGPVGSVIGRSFVDLLAGVVGVLLGPARCAARGAGRPLPAAARRRPPCRYGFRHALICDAIYARIPDAERAGCMPGSPRSRRPGDFSDAFLSLQLERAGKRAEAFDAARRAGAAATMISAHREAFELYARALRNAPPDLEPAERAALVEGHAREAAAIDDNRTAADGFEAARGVAGGRVGPRRGGAVGAALGALHLLGADLAQRADAWPRRCRGAGGRGRRRGGRRRGDDRGPRPDRGGARRRVHAQPAARRGSGPRKVEPGGLLARRPRDDATLRNAEVTLAVCLAFRGEMVERPSRCSAADRGGRTGGARPRRRAGTGCSARWRR